MLSLALSLSLIASASAAKPDCTRPEAIEIYECARVKFDAADKELNITYQQVLESLSRPPVDPSETQYREANRLLIQAQRAWVSFRQKDCDAVRTYWRDSPIPTSMYFECMINRTEQRTRELASFIEAY